MDRTTGRVGRRINDGRRTQLAAMVWTDRNAAVRALASAVTLALLALAALSALGGAQVARRDSSGWVRAPQVLARSVSDTLGGRRAGRRAGGADTIDAASIAASVKGGADSITRIPAGLGARYRSRTDSIASVRTRLAADHAADLRIVISLNDRKLWALIGPDTLLRAPVAVSTDEKFAYAGKTWTFETPRGVRSVIGKRENPVWIPPDWHYAEVAREHSLELASMMPGKPTLLSDGSRLVVRNRRVGIVDAESGEFADLPTDEEVIFDETLFIPPVGTLNRRIEGELGKHMLDTGNGVLLHGTPHKRSIGTAATHGCIRLRDEDLQWLYDMMPVGTRVYIY